jgi:hypothetical protein
MIVCKKEGVSARNLLGIGGSTSTNALALPSKFIGVRGVPGGFVAGVTTGLAMLKEFSSGGVQHQKSLWTVHWCQCFTEVCKTFNLCRLHSAETCKSDWFDRGLIGFGSGNLVSDTFVKWLSRGEEHKWSR